MVVNLIVVSLSTRAGCLDGKLYAIEAETGEELWGFDAASPIVASPVLMGDLLIIADESGTVYVFDISAEFGDEAVPLRTISIGATVRRARHVLGDLPLQVFAELRAGGLEHGQIPPAGVHGGVLQAIVGLRAKGRHHHAPGRRPKPRPISD